MVSWASQETDWEGVQKALLSSEGNFIRVLGHHEITASSVRKIGADQSSVCLSPRVLVVQTRAPCVSVLVFQRQSWCVTA